MIYIDNILDFSFFNNSVKQYLIAMFLFFAIRFFLYILQKKIIKNIKKRLFLNKKNIGQLLIDFVDGLPSLFFIVVSLIPIFFFLKLPNNIDLLLIKIFTLVSSFFLIKLVYKILYYYLIDVYLPIEDGNPTTVNATKRNILEMIIKVFVWVIGLLFVLNNIGVEITSLIASLGVGGIALGFALQNILTDILASFSIFFDKPFQIGDYIKVGDDNGTVIDISFKSTRIQTLDGQILTIPNKDISNARINNYAHITKRRTKINLGVIYETDLNKLKKIPDLIKECINKQDRVEVVWSVFKGYGDFSINFETVFYIYTSSYKEFLKIKNVINYDIFETFKKEGIEFAYPTQVVKLEK